MPPKKRAKPTAVSTPRASTPSKTPNKDLPPPTMIPLDLLTDPWTDDQETSLYKSIIRWKPTGVHKHIHMIQIASAHTRIPGIWRKLSQLYDLDALDERENAHSLLGWPDVAERPRAPGPEPDANAADGPWFRLPDDEFAQLLWDRRIATDAAEEAELEPEHGGSSTKPARGAGARKKSKASAAAAAAAAAAVRSVSPPACPELLARVGDILPTLLEQDELLAGHVSADEGGRSTPVTKGRAGAGAGGAGGRGGKAAGGRGRGGGAGGGGRGRGAPKAQSTDPEDEDEDEDEEDEEEEESSEEEEEDEDSSPPERGSGRGARGGRRGGRGAKRGAAGRSRR
ncbi:uncharacterized protein K452DRAFT_353785 [Aplosporella prunicola CBS 121167]|uniref:Chromatin modification-related protein EAF7 n=1 Tax=Aplosporella prunicola CBS 121167 TaxID=1176127 RepID=A0A6A6AZR3_9PEZI|nr:uncharacterized protein K452DRAFT_353785 [Aplosporella prunicola CBS 121167]KAF2136758.1 hypothetical protein K452DRAFT_353785 [Aplosporella prunicola CBS 121167]